MSAYELLDLAFNLSNRNDVQWSLFITIHLALFGGIVYVDRPLRKIEKIGAIILYGGFAYINFKMMVAQTRMLETIYQELAKFSTDVCCRDNLVVLHAAAEMDAGRFESVNHWLIGLHLTMLVLVVIAVILDKKIKHDINED